MPKPPQLSATLAAVRSDLYSSLSHKLKDLPKPPIPLHVGDTWLEPADGARMEDFTVREHPGMHRYSRPHGHPDLVAAVADLRDVSPDRILVTAGATGGLCALAGSLLDPGDEVLVLAPFWPLIRGIVQAARATAVEVPFYDRPGSVRSRIAPFLTERTAALYVNSPNNPTGRVLAADDVAELAELAREANLWLWSDEVYEPFAYDAPHVPVAPLAPERTFTAHSFSKSYGMAGNRVGYVLGPTDPAPLLHARKVATHTFYSAPTAGQLAAAAALAHGGPWLERAHVLYRDAGRAAAETLGLAPPQGGTFLFFDVAHRLDEERGLLGFLEDCLDAGVLLAPGSSCGADYGTHVRLCFTSAPPDVVADGVARVAALL
jgi:N-succinyldiaminopimelate aminotransferase